MMLERMKYLNVALPAEIEKAKEFGDFERAERMADLMISLEDTPECMRERLLLEKEIIRRLPLHYPYSEEEGLALIRKEIPDFTMEELHHWEDTGAADYIYINGEVRLLELFFASMKKVYPEIAERAGADGSAGLSYLKENIKDMKKNGRAGWHIHMKHTFRISDQAFVPGKVLVHLPVPAACMNMKNIRIIRTEPEECILSEASSECRTAAFIADLKENRTFSVEYEYDSEVEYKELKPEEALPCTIAECLQEEEPQIVFTPLIRKLCAELCGDEKNPVILARRFYDYCTKNCTYSFTAEYMTLGNIPERFASRRKGDCGVQALLFITLCRCAGIPAQWQSGLYVNPETTGNHDWAMFYVEPYGWCFADCSFGGAAYRAGDLERHDFYFGNLDPFRMAANNAFQREMYPAKKHYRYDPYDNQSGECEYEDHGLIYQEFESEKKIIEIHKLY